MNRYILQVFYAIFSGIVLALSISNDLMPFGSPLIALVSLIPLYLALYYCSSYNRAGWLFALQAGVTHVCSSFWLANFHGYAIFTLGASAFGTMLEGYLCGVIAYTLPHRLMEARNKYLVLKEKSGSEFMLPVYRVIWFVGAWLFWEWIKSVGALGYPWGTLSMASYKWRLLNQISDVTGVWGISAHYVLFSAIAAEVILAWPRFFRCKNTRGTLKSLFLTTLMFFLVSNLYGTYQVLIPRTPIKHLNAVIVQQNVDSWESGEGKSIEISTELSEKEIKRMRDEGMEVDLVMWSEGILNRPFPSSRTYYERNPGDEGLSGFIKRMGVPFLIGGTVTVNPDKKHFSNSAILFDKNGKYSGFYSKIHLVPFAEVIPYGENPLMQAFMGKIVGFSAGWTPGSQYTMFKIPLSDYKNKVTPLEYKMPVFAEIPLDRYAISNSSITSKYITNSEESPLSSVRFTTPICFEDAFNDVCRVLYNSGSEIFLNITNDSWSKTPPAEYQHYIAASYRAIEYRTTLVRCANAGYSVVVDPAGKVLADLPVFTTASLGYSVPVYERTSTIYSRYGDWFIHIVAALYILYLVFAIFRTHLEERHSKKRFILEIKIKRI